MVRLVGSEGADGGGAGGWGVVAGGEGEGDGRGSGEGDGAGDVGAGWQPPTSATISKDKTRIIANLLDMLNVIINLNLVPQQICILQSDLSL